MQSLWLILTIPVLITEIISECGIPFYALFEELDNAIDNITDKIVTSFV